MRPPETEIEELRAEVALAEAPGSDEERTQTTIKSEIMEKLFPVITLDKYRKKRRRMQVYLQVVFLIKHSLLVMKMVSYANSVFV